MHASIACTHCNRTVTAIVLLNSQELVCCLLRFHVGGFLASAHSQLHRIYQRRVRSRFLQFDPGREHDISIGECHPFIPSRTVSIHFSMRMFCPGSASVEEHVVPSDSNLQRVLSGQAHDPCCVTPSNDIDALMAAIPLLRTGIFQLRTAMKLHCAAIPTFM